jgi:hypothetical protein
VDLSSGARTPFREIAPPTRTGVVAIRVTQWADDGRTYAYDFERRTDVLFLVK